MADPIHQFKIEPLLPLGSKIHLDFTNSSFYMVLAVGITAALMLGATASRRIVPGRIQSVAERFSRPRPQGLL
jgi:F-type H+-transporting ATPase subunit a